MLGLGCSKSDLYPVNKQHATELLVDFKRKKHCLSRRDSTVINRLKIGYTRLTFLIHPMFHITTEH